MQSTKASRCSVNLTKISTSSDSVVVNFSTSGGLSCNFTLQANEETQAQSTTCESDGESEIGFTCQITALQPGTLYHLMVISNKDGEKRNTSVRTGKFAAFLGTLITFSQLELKLSKVMSYYGTLLTFLYSHSNESHRYA